MCAMKQSWNKRAITVLNICTLIVFAVMLYIFLVNPGTVEIFGKTVNARHYSKPIFLLACLWFVKQVLMLFERRKRPANTMIWCYLGIGIVAGASLLLEVTMTRIFAVAFFHHFAFLIISTALFGFGFSGVILSIFPFVNTFDMNKLLTVLSACFAITTIITLKVVVEVPLQFGAVRQQSVEFFLYLSIYYLAMAIPFFFSGMVVALLLSNVAEKVNKLYFADLLGAGIGCFLVLPLIPAVGAPGTVLIAAILGLIAAACFAKLIGERAVLVTIGLVIAVTLLLPFRQSHFQVKVHEGKRNFDYLKQWREFTRWGPISRIDVTKYNTDKIIWIDGGSNQAYMKPFNGDLEALQAEEAIQNRAGVVFRLVDNPDVLTVGPAGGEEVLYALSHKPNSITGVELDPVIVDIVQNEYREFIGGIYNLPNVTLICDEGRSYIRRSPEKYDIIQQINNASPVAIASGAVNVSETYLITVEAFHDYLDHLKENGFLFIRRWGAIRLATVAAQTLRERGVEDPENHIIIMDDPLHDFGGGQFYLKNGDFTEHDIAEFQKYVEADMVLYAPEAFGVKHKDYEQYRRLIAEPDGWKMYEKEGINVFPVTDDKPFFNHFKKFAHFSLENIPPEFHPIFEKYNNTDFSLLAILVEAAVLSVVFILLPLYIFKRSDLHTPGKFRFLIYFFSLGLGFILIEIVLIQKFTLFMGNPTYSVTVVLFSILVSAGCGSFLTGTMQNTLKGSLLTVVIGIVLLSWLQLTISPKIFNMFLGYSMPVRVLVSIALIAPLGLLMGMPFPLGVALTNRVAKCLIPWGWGINGYATVIGSVLCVILALTFGFNNVMYIACGIYLVGMFTLLGVEY